LLENNNFKKALIILVTVIIFYGIILFLSDLNKISQILTNVKIELYFLLFPLTFLTLLIQGWRYHLTLAKLNIRLSFKESFLIYLSGLSMTLTPGGAGSIIKSHILKKKTGRSFSNTTPVIIYEKWLELVAIITIIGILLFWSDLLESKIIFGIGVFISIFVFIIFKKNMGLQFLNSILYKFKFLKRFNIEIHEFKTATKQLTTWKSFLELLGITYLSKIVPMISVYLVFSIFGLDFNIFSSSQIYFTSLIAGILSFIPGGIVITEGSFLGLLIKTGVSFSSATVLVLLVRFLTFWFPTILGFIALKKLSKNL